MHIPDYSIVELFDCWSILQPLITILLCLLSVFVVLGNSLVVSAIWHENQLHSVTNYLIASLAASDCLVGAVVMPFSILSEIIIGSWTFGATWCDLWHSFDVLASTASIMNLCAISLDRYLAITDPISYPARMTPKRVALLIVSLWTCSSLISFPAIIWWRSVGQGSLQKIYPPLSQPKLTKSQEKIETTTSTNMISSSNLPMMIFSTNFNENETDLAPIDKVLAIETSNMQEPIYKCVFTDDTYYLLFSSFVSFYGPLCVMLYAYYRIYKAAVKQTRFLEHGSKQVMLEDRTQRYKNGTMNNLERQQVVLRAHRGGGNNTNNHLKTNTSNLRNQATKQSPAITTKIDKTKISAQESNQQQQQQEQQQQQQQQSEPNCSSSLSEKGQMLYFDSGKLLQSIVDLNALDYIDRPERLSTTNEVECSSQFEPITPSETSKTAEQVQLSDEKHLNVTRHHKSVGRKLSRLAKERKAAKTLGIVVGVFILCWLPFFVVNIIVALCGSHCIYRIDVFLAIVTWLGYLNSAMNPVIYACWSRDFRRAFRKVLCTWVEFVCPYKHACLAKKLGLKKKISNHNAHSNQEPYLNRNLSSMKGNSSSVRTGVSIEVREYTSNMPNGGSCPSQSLLSDKPIE